MQNRITGGGTPFFQDLNPVPRMYSFSTFDSLNGGYIRLSQNPSTGDGGTCFGDSGGPNFLNVDGTRTLVAITITGDSVCRSTNVDLPSRYAMARAFLAPFVSLPYLSASASGAAALQLPASGCSLLAGSRQPAAGSRCR